MSPKQTIIHGNRFPFDASDAWWSSRDKPCPPENWAHSAARGVIVDLENRQGVKHALAGIDEITRKEIVRDLARIILTAYAT